MLFFDSMLWGVGENKAKRMTTNMANKTDVQNMILAHIMKLNEDICRDVILGSSSFLIRVRGLGTLGHLIHLGSSLTNPYKAFLCAYARVSW